MRHAEVNCAATIRRLSLGMDTGRAGLRLGSKRGVVRWADDVMDYYNRKHLVDHSEEDEDDSGRHGSL